ncbi:hypothetical protein AMTR_s00060p00120850 [Amborella trichopoda]|uniref:Uncharacterized protein n=1 Tax=Amborella trichopoda TaxID=13333 RepID=W1NKU4_AMBTC|nr:hypothetical protein AMTR_s00060p00120850 [Amborella trichopoda]
MEDENPSMEPTPDPSPPAVMAIEITHNRPSSHQRGRHQDHEPTAVVKASSSFDDFEKEAHDAALEVEGKENLDHEKVSHLQELVKKLRREVDHYQYLAEYYEGEANHAKTILASVQKEGGQDFDDHLHPGLI